MLATARSGGDKINPMAFYDVAAVVIRRDGTVITEHHSTSRIGDEVRSQPCGSYGTHCKAYMLPAVGELRALGDFTSHPDDAFSLAYGFDDSLNGAMNGDFPGVTDTPSEARAITKHVFFEAEHRFASPVIEQFVGHALAESL